MSAASPSLSPEHGQVASASAYSRILDTVAARGEISIADLLAPSRSRAHIASARQIAMYLCHVGVGRSLTDVGAFFGRDRTTVAHACSLVEDRRDDPAFDAWLDELEQVSLQAPTEPGDAA